MNDEQCQLARHALGLDRATQSYRNRYVTGQPMLRHHLWNDMVSKGWATHNGRGVFHLTQAGATMVLLPGETLCAEDFPS